MELADSRGHHHYNEPLPALDIKNNQLFGPQNNKRDRTDPWTSQLSSPDRLRRAMPVGHPVPGATVSKLQIY